MAQQDLWLYILGFASSYKFTCNKYINTFATMVLVTLSIIIASAVGAEYTLPGPCPKIKAFENIDFVMFTGLWYTAAVYASDGRITYDCSVLDFQEDNLGYTLRETFVDVDNGDRIQKSYFARIDSITNTSDKEARYVISHTENDKVLHFPFVILSTDYSTYALTYTCRATKKKEKHHYIFASILARSKEALSQNKIESIVSGYSELLEHLFILKDFADVICSYNIKNTGESFTDNFW